MQHITATFIKYCAKCKSAI